MCQNVMGHILQINVTGFMHLGVKLVVECVSQDILIQMSQKLKYT